MAGDSTLLKNKHWNILKSVRFTLIKENMSHDGTRRRAHMKGTEIADMHRMLGFLYAAHMLNNIIRVRKTLNEKEKS